MKQQIISLLLLTSLSQEGGFYLGYDFLKDRNDISINKNQIYTELANPLKTEPVFMVLQKDLTDIN